MDEVSALQDTNSFDDSSYHTICGPIKSYEDVFSVALHPPRWFSQTSRITPRSGQIIDNSTYGQTAFSIGKLPARVAKSKTPKTILCHDMKNGYLEDKYTDECIQIGNGYTFTEWHSIDMFIYFSHHFITIPPLAWIQCAHRNGVQILGTIITEWNDGAALCNQFLLDAAEVSKFVAALVQISVHCKLDGWLINIENPIHAEQMQLLIQFVSELTESIHDHVPNGVVLWYDSVINTGELQWQNELNDLNRCFFDVCDGIFLNYSWKEVNIRTSELNASTRHLDVYVGIDVFGRNTPYEAGLDCYKGIRTARESNLSVAIFAPGWTHECLEPNPPESFFERFLANNAEFWSALWPYLYTHPVANLFDSTFHPGATKELYNLCQQGLQLQDIGGCLQSQIINDSCHYKMKRNVCDSKFSWYHLLATDIALQGKYSLIVETRSFTKNGCKQIDVVLQFLQDDKLSAITCRPENKGVDSVDDVDVVYSQNASCDLSSDSSPWYYNLKFKEKVRLMHINALTSSDEEVYLTRLGLVQDMEQTSRIEQE